VSLQVPFGILSDRVGRSWIIVTGLGLLALACVGFAVAESSGVWIALRILQGFAVAALLPSLRALVADVSTIEQRGEAFAGFNAAFFGGIFGGPLIGGIVVELAGSATLFLGASVAAVGIAAAVWLRFPEFRRPIASHHVAHDEPVATGMAAVRVLLAPALLGAFMLGAAIQVPAGLATAIWSIYVSDLGGSDFVVGATYSTFSIPLLLLAAVAGRAASRRPRWRLLLVTNTLLAVFVAAYGLIAWIPSLIFFGVLEGIVVAFAAPAIDAYMTSIADPRMMGRVQGIFATCGTGGAAAVGWLSAELYDIDAALPFVVSGGLVLALVLPGIALVRAAEAHLTPGRPIVTPESVA
jgi:MFS transporter, DHA1 family, multidrug resistance protein